MPNCPTGDCCLPRDFWKGKSLSRVPDERARTGHPADKVGGDPAAGVSEDPGPKAPLAHVASGSRISLRTQSSLRRLRKLVCVARGLAALVQDTRPFTRPDLRLHTVVHCARREQLVRLVCRTDTAIASRRHEKNRRWSRRK